MESKVNNLLSDKQAIALQFALFFTFQGLIAITFSFFGISPNINNSIITIEFSLFLQQLVIFGASAWITSKLQGEKFPIDMKINLSILFIAIVGLIGSSFITPFIIIPKELLQNLSPTLGKTLIELEEQVENILKKLFENENIFILIILIGIVPAIFEEIFFRGVLLKNLIRVMNPYIAIVLNGFIFSLIHGQIFGFFARWLLGSFFDFIFFKTKNLLYTIMLHLIFNTTSLIMSVFVAKSVNWETEKEIPFYLLLTGILLLFFSIFGLYKMNNNGQSH